MLTESRVWYLATKLILCSVGLSWPGTLYWEMQRDLRDFDATIAIVAVSDDEGEAKTQSLVHGQ